MKFFNKIKGFTLAEVMITLMIIGIISAIAIPVALHSKPDENLIKFKKAHETLAQVINTLVTSDKYFLAGDLGVSANGDLIDGTHTGDKTYLCNSMADVLSTKSVNCSDYDGLSTFDYNILLAINWSNNSYKRVDNTCRDAAVHVGEEIVTPDGIVFYQAAPGYTYHRAGFMNNEFDNNGNIIDVEHADKPLYTISKGFYITGKIFCIDVDGIPAGGSANCDDIKDICPFSYGIRWDGKIIDGARAKEWLEKDISGKKEDEES